MSAMNIRDALVAAMQATSATKPRKVETKQWGTVYVREVTVADIDAREERPNDKNRLARAAAEVICDKDGKLLFNADSAEDVKLISAQPWDLLSELVGKKATEGN
jgi:selenophosphate synthetase-related protein